MLTNQFKVFDSHLHIIDPVFPLIVNNGYLPPSFTAQHYIERMKSYDLVGGAIVSGSFQGFDQSYLIAALKRMGPSFIGIAQIPASITDSHLVYLNKSGITGMRVNLKQGGAENLILLNKLAQRAYDTVGWHTELYVDSADLASLYPILKTLPALCIDHLGLSGTGQKTLLKLVEQGTRVKASGFGRVDFNVPSMLSDLYHANPHALMFGTDVPSTRSKQAYTDSDFFLVIDALGPEKAENVFYKNASAFYKVSCEVV